LESQPLVEHAGSGIGFEHIKVEVTPRLRRRANKIASHLGAEAATLPLGEDAKGVKGGKVFVSNDHHKADVAPAMTNHVCRLNLELLMELPALALFIPTPAGRRDRILERAKEYLLEEWDVLLRHCTCQNFRTSLIFQL